VCRLLHSRNLYRSSVRRTVSSIDDPRAARRGPNDDHGGKRQRHQEVKIQCYGGVSVTSRTNEKLLTNRRCSSILDVSNYMSHSNMPKNRFLTEHGPTLSILQIKTTCVSTRHYSNAPRIKNYMMNCNRVCCDGEAFKSFWQAIKR
jgi:hypothetical protein